MNTSLDVLTLVQGALELCVYLAGPILITALFVGLLVSIFQAATSINEMTLTFVPKLIAVFFVGIVIGPWMIQKFVDYITYLYQSIPTVINGG